MWGEPFLEKYNIFSDFQALISFLEKIYEFFKLEARKLHYPKYKKFFQSEFFLFFELRKFPPEI